MTKPPNEIILQAEQINDVLVRPQFVSEPEADREQARVHQLMDLHPNLAITAQHVLANDQDEHDL